MKLLGLHSGVMPSSIYKSRNFMKLLGSQTEFFSIPAIYKSRNFMKLLGSQTEFFSIPAIYKSRNFMKLLGVKFGMQKQSNLQE